MYPIVQPFFCFRGSLSYWPKRSDIKTSSQPRALASAQLISVAQGEKQVSLGIQILKSLPLNNLIDRWQETV